MSAGETLADKMARAGLRPINGVEGVELPILDADADGEAPSAGAGTTWVPVDLGPALDGTYSPPEPTVGQRSDGVGLFYPGRLHVIAAEPEALKTWFALMACITEMERGNVAVFLDFEDEVGATVDRLLTLGCSAETIRRYFRYISPESPFDPRAAGYLAEGIEGATITILDGVTEAMSLHGLSFMDNDDVAAFWRRLPRWLAKLGPAVVMLDHVTKSTENRGRWAIGGQHKLAGLNGAQYTLDRVHPFGVGMKGVSRIGIAKDRPGQLRRHSKPAGEGMQWFADLVLDGTGLGPLNAEIAPPVKQEGPFRPTGVMAKVADALTRAGAPLTVRGIEDRVTGKSDVIRKAVAALVDEGYVKVEKQGQAHLHSLVKPFDGGSK